MRSQPGFIVATLVLLAGTTACQESKEGGEVAVWHLDGGQALGPDTTSFTAMVTRLECANGVTGQVLAPDVEYEAHAIVVTFTVAENDDGPADCQGNDSVAWAVELSEPLGDRRLVDGQCAPGTNASTTSLCSRSGVRYPPRRRAPVAVVLFSGRIAYPHLTLTTWGKCPFRIGRVQRVDATTTKVTGRDASQGCGDEIRRHATTRRLKPEHRRGGEFVEKVVVVSREPAYTVEAQVRRVLA